MRARDLDDGAAALDSNAILEHQAACLRQKAVFNGLDALVESLPGVVRFYCHRLLEKDRSVVDLLIDEVHRRAGHFDPVLQRIADSVRSGEGRQQRRMEIDEASGESINEHRGKYSHETGRDDQVGRPFLDCGLQGGAPFVARGVLGRVEDGRLDPPRPRDLNTPAGPVRHDQNHRARHQARIARICQALHVGSRSRHKYCDSPVHDAEHTRAATRAGAAPGKCASLCGTWVRRRFVAEADAEKATTQYGWAMARIRLRRTRRPHPFVVDGLFALLLTALSVAGLLTVQEYAPEEARIKDPDALGVILAALQTLPLAWRRRHPEQVLSAVGVATLVFYASRYETTTGGIGVMVALYTVASLCSRRTSLVSAATTAVALAVLLAIAEDVSADIVISNYVIFGTAWILGDNIRTRRAYTANLEERAARLEHDREESSRRAAAEERERIARELHDIVAHSVSVMVVQAGAARRVLEAKASPAPARDALRQIEDTGRSALTDMRRMLGILRNPDEIADLSPQPGLAHLDPLIAQATEAGVPVDYEILGRPRPLPSGMDLSAYRIVQEALTNTIKHAGPARARVVVRYEHDRVEIEVFDDGRGAARDLQKSNGGHGLVGMKERAGLYGGKLKAGPRAGGGYSVKVTLPLEIAGT